MIVMGTILATVASSIRGRTAIEDVVESVTGGRVHIGLFPFTDWGVYVDETDVLDWVDEMDILDEIDYIVDEDVLFNQNYSIWKGQVERFNLGNDIRQLDFVVGACSFTTEVSPNEDFYLEAQYAGKLQCYVEDGTLYLRSTASVKKWNELNGCRVILYVPEGARFEEADIEVGAGELEFDGLQAEDISLEVGAGQISMSDLRAEKLNVSVGFGQMELSEMEIGELDAEIGMGEFVAVGALNGDADVVCSMGNVSLALEGSQRDFNYSLSKAMGNVTLGGFSSSGFSSEKDIDNNANKTIDIECAVGNVAIRFTK